MSCQVGTRSRSIERLEADERAMETGNTSTRFPASARALLSLVSVHGLKDVLYRSSCNVIKFLLFVRSFRRTKMQPSSILFGCIRDVQLGTPHTSFGTTIRLLIHLQ
jgi:hypothetical protein